MADNTKFLDIPSYLSRTGPRSVSTLRSYSLKNRRAPNVVMLLSDDEGIGEWWGSLRPDMEAFLEGGSIVAQDGHTYTLPGATYFNNYRDVISLCRPSRTSEMSGQYAQNNTIWGNYPYDGDVTIDGEKLLWRMLWGSLNDRLYQTGQVGKFLGPGFEPGWDTPASLFSQATPTPCWNYIDETYVITGSSLDVGLYGTNPGGRAAAKYGWQCTEIHRNANGQIMDTRFFPAAGQPLGTSDPALPYATDYFIDRMIQCINTFMTRDSSDPRKNIPFWLNVWPTTPHDPYDPPPIGGMYDRPGSRSRATRLAYYGGGSLMPDGHKWVPPYWDYMRYPKASSWEDLLAYRPVDFRDNHIQGPGGTVGTSGAWTGGVPGVGTFSGGAWTDRLYTTQAGPSLIEDFNRKKLSVGFDDMLAALIMTLAYWGVLEDTIVIINSDNGWNRGVVTPMSTTEKTWTNKDGFNEESLRVPLAICDFRPDPEFEPNTICDSHCWNLDLLPTVSRLTNIDIPWERDNGYALQDQIADPRAMDERVMSIGVGRPDKETPIQHGAMNSRYKVTYIKNNLLDLAIDPFEQVDRQDDPAYANVLAHMDQLRAFGHTCHGMSGPDSCDMSFTIDDPETVTS